MVYRARPPGRPANRYVIVNDILRLIDYYEIHDTDVIRICRLGDHVLNDYRKDRCPAPRLDVLQKLVDLLDCEIRLVRDQTVVWPERETPPLPKLVKPPRPPRGWKITP
jgi:hypothetical protein